MNVNKQPIKANYFIFILILMPAITYIFIIYHYAVDAPIADDYNSVLEFLNNYNNMHQYIEKITYLFHPHNEYKLVFSNIVQVLILKTNGIMNFKYLIYIGNIGLVGIFILFYSRFKIFNLPIIYILPVSLLLFNFSAYNMAFWPMASMQGYWQILFALLSIHFLIQNKHKYSIIFYVMTMIQGGLWVSLFPVILLHYMLKRDHKYLTVLLIITILILIIMYATGMNQPGHSILNNLKQGFHLILFSLGVLGSISNNFNIAVVFGLLIVVWYIFVLWKFKTSLLSSFSFHAMTMILISSAGLAVNRIHTGLEACLSSRYSLISLLMISLIYMLLLEKCHQKKFVKKIFYLFLTFSLLMYIFNTRFIDKIEHRKEYLQSTFYPYFNDLFARTILKESTISKIYNRTLKYGSMKVYDVDMIDLKFKNIVSTSQIIHNTYQINAMYNPSKNFKYVILGSYIKGDASKANIYFSMNKNQYFLLSTGPRNSGQRISFFDMDNHFIKEELLPAMSNGWVLIKIISKDMPLNFKVQISDNSSKWGEWNAIALEKK
ncbi:MAG: hypothetical protein QM490_06235 [Candidatus Gracilibacteria bacterium]